MNGVQEVVLIVLYVTLALLSLQLLVILTDDKLIATLLLLMIVSTALLWNLNTSLLSSNQVFAVFLAADLLGFSMISYSYRTSKMNGLPSRTWMLVVCGSMSILIIAGLAIA